MVVEVAWTRIALPCHVCTVYHVPCMHRIRFVRQVGQFVFWGYKDAGKRKRKEEKGGGRMGMTMTTMDDEQQVRTIHAAWLLFIQP